jgi:hypothetical protein
MTELNTLKKSLELIELCLNNLPTADPAVEHKATIKELKALIRRESLRHLLLSEDVGLTAQDCEWVNEAKEGDLVRLRGGKSAVKIKSVHRQPGLAPDYFTLILAGCDTLELSGDELADLYEPAAQPAVPLTDENIDRIVFAFTGFDGDGTQAMTIHEVRSIVRAVARSCFAAPEKGQP